MHVLKLGKVVNDIAEHIVENRVCQALGIVIQQSNASGCLVLHALLVIKDAA